MTSLSENPWLPRFRFFLELLALPFFIFLVAHLAGHGSMLLFESEHTHGASESFWSEETLFGILFLVIFTGIWHLRAFRKWVPCQHEHCHIESSRAHFFAILAFCLHFFPEAGVRHELFSEFSANDALSISAMIGFVSHFLVDVIVAILLVSYFASRTKTLLTFGGIVLAWILAFFVGARFSEVLPGSAESAIFLVSAFLLAMFIHLPHPPKDCGKCHHH